MEAEREAKLEQEIARSNDARFITENPLFKESMAKLKQGVIDLWAACPARDTPGREWLWQHYQVALKFEETLTEVLNTGKLAVKEREMSLAEKAMTKLRAVI